LPVNVMVTLTGDSDGLERMFITPVGWLTSSASMPA